jgi:hypothetical protein
LVEVERYMAILAEVAERLPPEAAGARIFHERVQRTLAKMPAPAAALYDPTGRALRKGAPGDSWDLPS